MGMAEDIAQIKWAVSQLGDTASLVEGIDNIRNTLRYDIEPKLDKALEGKTGATETEKKNPHHVSVQLKYMLLHIHADRKIEAIKALREATDLGLKEAKDTVEWIEERLIIIRQQAIDNYKDNNEKEAE